MGILIPQLPWQNILHFIIPTISIIVVLCITLFRNDKSISLIVSLCSLSLIVSIMLCFISIGKDSIAFTNVISIDRYSIAFSIIFLITTLLVILISFDYLKKISIIAGEYIVLLLCSTLGMMIMASGVELITIFVGLEVMSIPLYILAGYERQNLKSNEAGLKYFLIGAFASAFFIYGIALLYGNTGSTDLQDISDVVSRLDNNRSRIVLLGIIFLIIGFGFKIASVPFHMWVPDVYEGAPTAITAFMSVGPKAAGFAAFVRLFMLSLEQFRPDWISIIWILAVLSMTIGNITALSQTNIKRMLAYSSIAHVGYILIAFVSVSTIGISSIIFYLMSYTFTNIGAFAVIMRLRDDNHEPTEIDELANVGFKYPISGLAMSIFMLSLAGIPPTSGFMAKFYIFSAAVKEGYIFLTVIAVINSVISVFYYLRVIIVMYMTPSSDIFSTSSSYHVYIALVISILGTLHMGIFPSLFLKLSEIVFIH